MVAVLILAAPQEPDKYPVWVVVIQIIWKPSKAVLVQEQVHRCWPQLYLLQLSGDKCSLFKAVRLLKPVDLNQYSGILCPEHESILDGSRWCSREPILEVRVDRHLSTP